MSPSLNCSSNLLKFIARFENEQLFCIMLTTEGNASFQAKKYFKLQILLLQCSRSVNAVSQCSWTENTAGGGTCINAANYSTGYSNNRDRCHSALQESEIQNVKLAPVLYTLFSHMPVSPGEINQLFVTFFFLCLFDVSMSMWHGLEL